MSRDAQPLQRQPSPTSLRSKHSPRSHPEADMVRYRPERETATLLRRRRSRCLLRFKRIIARFLPFTSRFLHPTRGGLMATQPVSPNDELVEVFGSKEESEVMVVRGLLEAA